MLALPLQGMTARGVQAKKKDENAYADLKANVLVEDDKCSMICEIQFLMDFMIKAKKKSHSIYEILRRKPFMENVSILSQAFANPKEELFAAICRNDYKEVSKLLVSFPSEALLDVETDKVPLTVMETMRMGDWRPGRETWAGLVRKKDDKKFMNLLLDTLYVLSNLNGAEGLNLTELCRNWLVCEILWRCSILSDGTPRAYRTHEVCTLPSLFIVSCACVLYGHHNVLYGLARVVALTADIGKISSLHRCVGYPQGV